MTIYATIMRGYYKTLKTDIFINHEFRKLKSSIYWLVLILVTVRETGKKKHYLNSKIFLEIMKPKIVLMFLVFLCLKFCDGQTLMSGKFFKKMTFVKYWTNKTYKSISNPVKNSIECVAICLVNICYYKRVDHKTYALNF
jgi:hypothetical protein